MTDAHDEGTGQQSTTDLPNNEHFNRDAGAALDVLERDLNAVESALARFDDGAYERCERCGRARSPEQLIERPSHMTCSACDES